MAGVRQWPSLPRPNIPGHYRDLPAPVQVTSRHAQGLRPRRIMQRTRDCALAYIAFRIGVQRRHPGFNHFAVQWLACRCPLSTLRYTPRDEQRMTRGQDGSLLLSCIGLSPTITCQFVLAHTPLFVLSRLSPGDSLFRPIS